jgi:hypothetical protein
VSVPVNKRAKGKFEVLIKARELAKYTIEITKNTKVFKPEYQTALTDDIIRTAKNVFIKCWTANNIRVNTKEQAEERNRLQYEADQDCNNLLALIDLAKVIYHLKSKRIKFWAEKTIVARTLIREWRTSDSKRYSAIL